MDKFRFLASDIIVKVKVNSKRRVSTVKTAEEIEEMIRAVCADHATVLAGEAAAAYAEEDNRRLNMLREKHINTFDQLLRATEQLAEARAHIIQLLTASSDIVNDLARRLLSK
jgi:multidrug resistance efflux pump